MFCIAYSPGLQQGQLLPEKYGLVIGNVVGRGDQWKIIPLVVADPELEDLFIPTLGKIKNVRFNEGMKDKLLSRELQHRLILVVKKSYIVSGWLLYQPGLVDPAELFCIDDALVPVEYMEFFLFLHLKASISCQLKVIYYLSFLHPRYWAYILKNLESLKRLDIH